MSCNVIIGGRSGNDSNGQLYLTEHQLSRRRRPVTRPLGLLVKNGFDVFSGLWWASMLPSLYIMLLVFGINLLGDFCRMSSIPG